MVALHLSNVSTELCCYDNQCEHLRTNSFPLLPHLMWVDGVLWVVHLCIDNKGFSTVMSWWLVLVISVILLCYWSSSWQFKPSVPFAGIFYHCWVHKCLYLVVVVIYSATKVLVPHLATVATNLKTNWLHTAVSPDVTAKVMYQRNSHRANVGLARYGHSKVFPAIRIVQTILLVLTVMTSLLQIPIYAFKLIM